MFKIMNAVVEDIGEDLDLTNPENEKNVGKVKVRIHGMHPPKDSGGFEDVKTEDLPWVEVINTKLFNGSGFKSFLEVGQNVYVLVYDDLRMKVIGSVQNTELNSVILGLFEDQYEAQEFSQGDVSIQEPQDLDTGTEYAKSDSYTSKNGHFIISDYTEGNERLKVQHSSGSFVEFRPDGSIFHKSEKDSYTIVKGDLNEAIQGKVQKYIKESLNLQVQEIIKVEQDGSITLKSQGQINIESQSDININSDGNVSVKGSIINLN